MYILNRTSLNTRRADILTQSHLVLAVAVVKPDVPLCDGLAKRESPGRACFFILSIHSRSLHFLPRNSSLIVSNKRILSSVAVQMLGMPCYLLYVV